MATALRDIAQMPDVSGSRERESATTQSTQTNPTRCERRRHRQPPRSVEGFKIFVAGEQKSGAVLTV